MDEEHVSLLPLLLCPTLAPFFHTASRLQYV